LGINKDGYWDGGRMDQLNAQHNTNLPLNNKLILFYKKEKPNKIIDFGCGVCYYVSSLKRAGFNAVGYDGNPFTK
jgi:2-polyprenyl-3-methyl-5-hydroxy-6-metoxy-1,4-benzoquinol methylase